jgi:hypothetical protein|tara:strand:+ start:612 stop:824 length:213 start_codon:yes stop_codon:yes gene_type:complete
MVKTLVILILLFNGEVIQEEYPLLREMSAYECLQYADDHREAIATHLDIGIKSGWYLKDNRGTVQGFICK